MSEYSYTNTQGSEKFQLGDLVIKVLSLNIWGIVGVSPNRRERINAIGNHLACSNYDFIFLQEVWSHEDFQIIKNKTTNILPYSHYFHSGVIGSGVCILSKVPILDTLLLRYSLNGFAHRILHGDWFGGKVVGLCRVNLHGLTINLYVTHLHAEYNPINDQYLAHRVTQALELSQFIKLTGPCADLIILGGDLNTEVKDILYRILIENVKCIDAFKCLEEQQQFLGYAATCGHPQNTYTTRKELKESPCGKRIDYIMFKSYNDNVTMTCNSFEIPTTSTVESKVSYSDHEPIIAQIVVSRRIQENGLNASSSQGQLSNVLREAKEILDENMTRIKGDSLFYIIMTVIGSLMLIASFFIILQPYFHIFITITQIILTLMIGFCFLMFLLVKKSEANSTLASIATINILSEPLFVEPPPALENFQFAH